MDWRQTSISWTTYRPWRGQITFSWKSFRRLHKLHKSSLFHLLWKNTRSKKYLYLDPPSSENKYATRIIERRGQKGFFLVFLSSIHFCSESFYKMTVAKSYRWDRCSVLRTSCTPGCSGWRRSRRRWYCRSSGSWQSRSRSWRGIPRDLKEN